MTEYQKYGVNLSKVQAQKIVIAHKKATGASIRLSNSNLHGDHKLPLTQTQINKIKKAKHGVQLELSETQLKHMEKTGGFLPLAALIPLIISGIGAAGGVAGSIASAVSSAKNNAEQLRHNRAIEEQLKSGATGAGVVSDLAGKIPLLGSYLQPLLQKIGLGIKDINKIKNGRCICHDLCQIKRIGSGIYLGPEGEGLFLAPPPAAQPLGR